MEKRVKLKKININSKNKENTVVKKVKDKVNNIYSKLNAAGIVVFFVCIVLLTSFVIYLTNNNDSKYTVINGKIEQSVLVPSCYVVKEETKVQKDESRVLLPIISDSNRVQKSAIIATYKGGQYENYEDKLLALDNEILEAMQDLPSVYSTEIESIDKQIASEILNGQKENSYVNMQNIKKTVNSFLNKKASLVADLSPSGSEIRQLISQRNNYESSAKKSNDNILASTSGVVSYTTDGLEDLLKISDIDNLTYDRIEEIVNSNGINQTSNIKIMNNYKAYIVMKVDGSYEKYLDLNSSYILRLVTNNNYEYTAKLVRFNEVDEGKKYELVFVVNNGIEKLLDIRKTEFEVVFETKEGLLVPNESVKTDEERSISYVTAIRYREYVEIPVHVKTKNNELSIVTSYSEDELKQMNLSLKKVLRLYENILEKAR